jgi:peptidoglycan/xylan/chitin deacetylase (PgdA/CDA1 family)
VWVAFAVAAAAGTAVGGHTWSSIKPAQAAVTHVTDDHPPAPVNEAALPTPGLLSTIEATTSRSRAWLLAEGPARDETHTKWVSLTFDDGPDADTTPSVLRLLDKHHVHATFFFIGRYLDGTKKRAVAARKAARDIQDAGHLIGSHTHDHDLLTTLTHTRVLDQIDEGIASIERATGKHPELFRPPYGQIDAFGEQAIAERHLGLVLWSIEAGDMQEPDEDAMFSHLVEQLDYSGGGLVLLHDVKWPTVHVLARLLDWLDAKKYSVVDLVTYFRETSAHPQPFATRKALEEARAGNWRATHAGS